MIYSLSLFIPGRTLSGSGGFVNNLLVAQRAVKKHYTPSPLTREKNKILYHPMGDVIEHPLSTDSSPYRERRTS